MSAIFRMFVAMALADLLFWIWPKGSRRDEAKCHLVRMAGMQGVEDRIWPYGGGD